MRLEKGLDLGQVGVEGPSRRGGGVRQHRLEAEIRVPDVGGATGHTGGEVSADVTDDQDLPPGHVLAPVIGAAFDDGCGARVAHREPLTDPACQIGLATGRPVEDGVPGGVGRRALGAPRRDRDQPPAHAFAQVVVGGALEMQIDSATEPGAEALPSGAGQLDHDGPGRKTLRPVPLGYLTGEPGPDRPVDVPDRVCELDRLSGCYRLGTVGSHSHRQAGERDLAIALVLFAPLGGDQHRREVGGERMLRVDRAQQIGPSHQFGHGPHTQGGHVAPRFLGEPSEQQHHLICRAGELRPQVLLLGGDPDRARVEMALADHLAAHGQQWEGPEAEPLGTEHGGHDDVPSGAKTTVGLEEHPRPLPVGGEDLMGLGQTQLPRRAGVLDRDQRRCAGAAFGAGDRDHVGIGLGHPDCDRAHTGLADQFHRDQGGRLEGLEVVDELGEVLDGVDVVVRRG